MALSYPLAVLHWRALSLKRLAHMEDLKRTGRWRSHYTTQQTFDEAHQEAVLDAEAWKKTVHRTADIESTR